MVSDKMSWYSRFDKDLPNITRRCIHEELYRTSSEVISAQAFVQ